MCNKVRHPTKVGAIIAWKHTGKNVQMNVFKCPKCKGWHLGHSNKATRKMDRINQILDSVL